MADVDQPYESNGDITRIRWPGKRVKVQDLMNGQEYEVKAKAVINATGIFVDSIMEMDVPTHEHMVKPSQGVHLVLDKSFCKVITLS